MIKKYYSYTEFITDVNSLAEQINVGFDAILPISRGGLTLGHFLGEYYGIREVYAINTIGYDDTCKLDSVRVFNIPDLTHAENVLIVDDIVDSGDTMVAVLDVLNDKFPQVKFLTAVLFYKPSALIRPDWYAQEAECWIDFFWSVDLTNG